MLCSRTVSTLLLYVLIITRFASANGRVPGQHLPHSQHKLKDVRKLQPDFWLKVAQHHLSSSASANTAACSRDYGEQYLQRWHALKGTYCNATATADSVTSSTASSIQCFAHPEADLSTCTAHNLLLTSTTAFLGKVPDSSELPQPARSSIQLACNTTAEPGTFLRGRLNSNEGSRAWLVTAPAFAPFTKRQQHACQGTHRIAHPVMLLLRVDPQNAFHNLETVVSVFAALAVAQLQPRVLRAGLEVVIADDRQRGYFLDVWRRLSWPHPLRLLRQQPYPDNTCFSTMLLAPYTAHAQSLLTYKAGSADEVVCESLVLQATSWWLRHLFRDLLPPGDTHRSHALLAPLKSHEGTSQALVASDSDEEAFSTSEGSEGGEASSDVSSRSSSSSSSSSSMSWRGRLHASAAADLAPLPPSPPQAQAPLELLYVVWISRRRFEQQEAAGLSNWQQARVLSQQQQEQLLLELQRAVLRWNEQSCVAQQQKDCQQRSVLFSLQVAELSELSFYPDQLSLMMRTAVLAGVHGAGLANQVFMTPRWGAVVEVWYGMDSNTHYHNMAHMLGHTYFNVKCEEEGVLDVAHVVSKVTAAMDDAAQKHAAAQTGAAKRKRSWWWHKRHAGGTHGAG